MEYPGVLLASYDTLPPLVLDPHTAEIRDHLRELSVMFAAHFDQNWLLLLLETHPIDAMVLNEIRGISDADIAFLDFDRMEQRVLLLEDFVRHLRRYIVPGLREKLGISGLNRGRQVWAQDQLLFRRLVAHTFPQNIDRLADLTDALRNLFERRRAAV